MKGFFNAEGDKTFELIFNIKIGTYKMDKKIYKNWLKLRESSTNDRGEKLCYCGHSYKCTCTDPDLQSFIESVENKTIIPDDPKNGWRSVKI